MIVVDNDVISYFWLDAARSGAVREVRRRDSDWHAPVLWRSALRSMLRQHMLHRDLRA
jgi:hypothetical protein